MDDLIQTSFSGDFHTWVDTCNVECHPFRVVLLMTEDENGEPFCGCAFFQQIIDLPDGDILIGLRGYDPETGMLDDALNYQRLSDMIVMYAPEDDRLLQ